MTPLRPRPWRGLRTVFITVFTKVRSVSGAASASSGAAACGTTRWRRWSSRRRAGEDLVRQERREAGLSTTADIGAPPSSGRCPWSGEESVKHPPKEEDSSYDIKMDFLWAVAAFGLGRDRNRGRLGRTLRSPDDHAVGQPVATSRGQSFVAGPAPAAPQGVPEPAIRLVIEPPPHPATAILLLSRLGAEIPDHRLVGVLLRPAPAFRHRDVVRGGQQRGLDADVEVPGVVQRVEYEPDDGLAVPAVDRLADEVDDLFDLGWGGDAVVVVDPGAEAPVVREGPQLGVIPPAALLDAVDGAVDAPAGAEVHLPLGVVPALEEHEGVLYAAGFDAGGTTIRRGVHALSRGRGQDFCRPRPPRFSGF